MKHPLSLESTGLIIELLNGDHTLITYQACTHGGWAKYIGVPNGKAEHTDNFESKSEIIEDANKIAKYYNQSLLVSI